MNGLSCEKCTAFTSSSIFAVISAMKRLVGEVHVRQAILASVEF